MFVLVGSVRYRVAAQEHPRLEQTGFSVDQDALGKESVPKGDVRKLVEKTDTDHKKAPRFAD